MPRVQRDRAAARNSGPEFRCRPWEWRVVLSPEFEPRSKGYLMAQDRWRALEAADAEAVAARQ